MNLNIVDIIIVAVLALSVISGMYKGFLASGLAAVGFVASWFGALNLYPQLASAIMNNTGLMEMLTYYLDVGSMFSPRAIGDTLVSSIVSDATQLKIAGEALQGHLPSAIINAFQSNVTGQIFSTHIVNGQKVEWLNTFTEYLNQTILASAIHVLSFILMFVVTYLIVLLIVNLLNNVFHFPLLKHLDWLPGGLFGLGRGVVIILLILAVVPMALSMLDLQVVNDLIDSSSLVQFFHAENFQIGDIIANAFKTITG